MKHRTTHVLLVVVAVLLALNLAAGLPWPTAQAQQPEFAMQPPPRLVAMTASRIARTEFVMHRMWSDGVVEWRQMASYLQWRQDEWQDVVPLP